MFPLLQLCQIVESGFYPLSCTCTVNPDGSLRVTIIDPESGRVKLLITGVSTATLTSVRETANFIGELRTELKAGRRAFAG
ncbi:hypothetical protein HK44_008600 [Pseudomonas fluorescens HK44]|uniref:DUF1652 domain-containing protein n=1 Tax=Pseudomonas fluorescens HK44 TaxID=1042209 RepID=A0A010SRT0_PSEFL|nr:DUF1652 domain-containing protein [Pseudomonas fluorescens]EXF93703.1 hypothetical protein HK44_008600 [Pseudomonas fluorescens HK44]